MSSTLTRPLGNALVGVDADGGLYMPVRHSVFEAYNSTIEFQVAYDEQRANCPDKRLLMENWECSSPDARTALHELKASINDPRFSPKYLGRAIPVHTADGELVLPSEYEQTLRGATFIVGFHILHQAFPEPDLAEQKVLRRHKIR